MKMLYHIAKSVDWIDAQANGKYEVSTLGKNLSQVGYIHLSFAHQVKKVADSVYHGVDDLVLLKINPDNLKSLVRIENALGTAEKFPHLYGPLDLEAVDEVNAYNVLDDGTFQNVDAE